MTVGAVGVGGGEGEVGERGLGVKRKLRGKNQFFAVMEPNWPETGLYMVSDAVLVVGPTWQKLQ